MAASLTLRDIGEDRKRALEAEALARGVPVAEVVRGLIDEGLARAKAEWIEAARPGLADEARHLEAHGPLLAQFRRVGPTQE